MIGREHLFVGLSGWSYPDWRGPFYPEKANRDFDELSYIAEFFDMVEIAASYYHPQSPEASGNWIRQVSGNARFRFTAKLWQKFVLEQTIYTSEDVKTVQRGIDVLLEADRFGALVVQFPQSFNNTLDNRSWLFRIITEFRMYPLVVELRHRSWDHPQVLEMLRDRHVGVANIDQPVIGEGQVFTAYSTAPIGYFRFHGRNVQSWLDEKSSRDERYDYEYTHAVLGEFVEPVTRVLKKSSRVFVVFNNYFRGQAPKNALQFLSLLIRQKVAIPESLAQCHGDLVAIRRPQNPKQLELF